MDKSFHRREILYLSAPLPESPNAWALFSLGPYFLVVFYSQWTYAGDGLAFCSTHGYGSVRPILPGPSGLIFILLTLYPNCVIDFTNPIS